MSEALAAILLVAGGSTSTSVVFHWPPNPTTSTRLRRPRIKYEVLGSELDNHWLAARNVDPTTTRIEDSSWHNSLEDEMDYEWRGPKSDDKYTRSRTYDGSGSPRPPSPKNSPSRDNSFDRTASVNGTRSDMKDLETIFGYSGNLLASILCPQRQLCHQKFELTVDELVFIGHPICVDANGKWKSKEDSTEGIDRGRGPNKKIENDTSMPQRGKTSSDGDTDRFSSMTTFHLVLVMDLPDPSSAQSGNLFKYFHVVYERVAFMVTAILFREQIENSFLDKECNIISSLRDASVSKGDPSQQYLASVLNASSLARLTESLYNAIKSNSIAQLIVNNVHFELQLPPHLDSLLHTDEELEDITEEDVSAMTWGRELSFGWRLPALAPWKSLLLFDVSAEKAELLSTMRNQDLSNEDREIAEGLKHFLDTATIHTSLAELAHSLSWDLEAQVFSTVRWLVYHRKAKVIDQIHEGLRNIFILAENIETPISELVSEFAKEFEQQGVPPLTKLLALISSSRSAPSLTTQESSRAAEKPDKHFFASVVQDKNHLPLYREVVTWMLKRDLLITLHLRVRVVATPEIKEAVRLLREKKREQKAGETNRWEGIIRRGGAMEKGGGRERRQETPLDRMINLKESKLLKVKMQAHQASDDEDEIIDHLSDHGHQSALSNRRASSTSRRSNLIPPVIYEEGRSPSSEEIEDDDSGAGWVGDDDDSGVASIILNPGQATPLERKWLEAMSTDKDEMIVRRFEKIYQYFDGKTTDDEILYKAEISRRQLRELLHQYDEYLLTFLHPA